MQGERPIVLLVDVPHFLLPIIFITRMLHLYITIEEHTDGFLDILIYGLKIALHCLVFYKASLSFCSKSLVFKYKWRRNEKKKKLYSQYSVQ